MACELAIAYVVGAERQASQICDTQKAHSDGRLRIIADEYVQESNSLRKQNGVDVFLRLVHRLEAGAKR